MRTRVPGAVVEAVADALEVSVVEVTESGSVGGGSIYPTARLRITSLGSFFLKWSTAVESDVFSCEAAGLDALAAVGAMQVPQPVARSTSPPFLLLDWIETGRANRSTSCDFGRELALLHRRSSDSDSAVPARYGFEVDNYIGANPQPNPWTDDWVEFFRDNRLGFQLELLKTAGQLDAESERAFSDLIARLPELIGEPAEPACLLHGDLWGGNYLVDSQGRAVLIDPAVYYGRREADLAMTRLFGGFDRAFYDAYEEFWPLEPGSVERQRVYGLYHLLNHWNLFGSGYRTACLEIALTYS